MPYLVYIVIQAHKLFMLFKFKSTAAIGTTVRIDLKTKCLAPLKTFPLRQ